MTTSRELLLISGSVRAGSTNVAVLRTAMALVPDGTRPVLFDGLARLPHFNPDEDRDPLPPAVADLRRRVAAADAILFSTPEYAGALPGALKNLLEWTVGGIEISATPCAWINASGVQSPSGGADAHDELARVLRYTDAAIVEAACVRIPVPRQAIGEDGTIADPELRRGVAGAVATLLAAADGGGS